jgi:ABC-type multidrug transport system fused ATPase/permease subunit
MVRNLQFAYIKDEADVNNSKTKGDIMMLIKDSKYKLLAGFLCIVFGIGFTYLLWFVIGIITKFINFIDHYDSNTNNNLIIHLLVRYFLLYLLLSRLVAKWNHNIALKMD